MRNIKHHAYGQRVWDVEHMSLLYWLRLEVWPMRLLSFKKSVVGDIWVGSDVFFFDSAVTIDQMVVKSESKHQWNTMPHECIKSLNESHLCVCWFCFCSVIQHVGEPFHGVIYWKELESLAISEQLVKQYQRYKHSHYMSFITTGYTLALEPQGIMEVIRILIPDKQTFHSQVLLVIKTWKSVYMWKVMQLSNG